MERQDACILGVCGGNQRQSSFLISGYLVVSLVQSSTPWSAGPNGRFLQRRSREAYGPRCRRLPRSRQAIEARQIRVNGVAVEFCDIRFEVGSVGDA